MSFQKETVIKLSGGQNLMSHIHNTACMSSQMWWL